MRKLCPSLGYTSISGEYSKQEKLCMEDKDLEKKNHNLENAIVILREA